MVGWHGIRCTSLGAQHFRVLGSFKTSVVGYNCNFLTRHYYKARLLYSVLFFPFLISVVRSSGETNYLYTVVINTASLSCK